MYCTGQYDIQCRDAWPAVLSVLPGKCSGKLDVHWAWYPLSMRHVSLPCHLVREIVTASVQGAPDKVPVAFHFPSVRQKATGLKAQPERLRYAWYHPLRILPQAQINTALPLFSRQSRYFLQCVWSPTAPANAGPTTAFSLYKTQWAAYPCLIRFIMIYRFVTSFLRQTMLNKRRRSRRFVRSGMSVNSSHTHVFEGEMRTCLTRCHLEFKAARIKVILHFQ